MHVPLWLELEGAVNARDVGGLPVVGGGVTRSGVLVRSDAVHELTSTDVATLVERLAVRHVVDLRTQGERGQHTRGRLGEASLRYSELEVLTDAMITERRQAREDALAAGLDDAAAVIADGYVQLLDLGRRAFVDALEQLVAPGGVPAVVHCSAGKDRTGVLVALLLAAAGVAREAIVADYAATDARMAQVRSRLAAMPAHAQLAAEAPGPMLAAHAATMERFLDRLDEAGGAGAWFLAAGAPPDAVDAWRSLLVG